MTRGVGRAELTWFKRVYAYLRRVPQAGYVAKKIKPADPITETPRDPITRLSSP